MKLYPPVIDNKIPAFYGDSITIPFKLNKAVSPNQIKGAVLLIKSAENVLLNFENKQITFEGIINDTYSKITFSNLSEKIKNDFSVGQFYKFQLAFVDNTNETGYYSNVGVAKYISQPLIQITNLEENQKSNIKMASHNYIGEYFYYTQDYYILSELLSNDFYQNDLIALLSNIPGKKELTNDQKKLFEKCKFYYSTLQNHFFYSAIKQYVVKINEILKIKDITLTDITQLNFEIEKIKAKKLENALTNPEYVNTSLESLYSYYFNLYDSNNMLVDSSGIKINFSTINTRGTITNTWYSSYKLEPYKDYYVEFGGTTINGLELNPVRYRVQSPDTIDLDINSDFIAELDCENGCIDISLQADSKFNSMIKYKFLVSRASDKDNYTTWEPIMKDIKSFNPKISNPNIELEDTPTFHIWTDCTIEQGVSYIYALQAYNDYNIFSNPIYSNRIKILSEETNELKKLLAQENNIFNQLEILINNEIYDLNLGSQVGAIISNNFIFFAQKLRIFDQNILTEMASLSLSMKMGDNINDHKNQLHTLYVFLKDLEQYIPSEVKDFYGGPGPILADFEHAYLFDGERQLKLAFNPKVSSFKNTILESKVDTLGGKYPFFFRNARVKYKEFPISGLISCLMDPDDKFLTGVNQLQLETHNNNGTINILDQYVGDTQLTSTNIYKERNFKMEVLEWLTNGQPKIFRSPTEGNFIVRLMNTSLSPNDTVGRMLHTFSSTAYEMADYTFDNLREYGFVDIDLTLKDQTIYICQTKITNDSELSFSKNLKYLKCEITEPHQGDVELNIYYSNATEPKLIKFRGTYIFPANSCNNIIKISILPKQKEVDGILQEVYEPIEVIWVYETSSPSNNFNYIKNIILSEENNQFIGGLGQINEPITSVTQNGKSWQQIDINNIQQKDIIQNELSNTEREVGQINYLRIYCRHIEDCWYNSENGVCYSQASKLTPETFAYADSLIYRVITDNKNYMVWRNALGQYLYITEENFNASNPYQIILNDQIFSLEANEINSKENLNLLHTLKATAYIDNPDKDYYFPIATETVIESTSINEINKLKVGLGLNIEMDYYVKTFEYDVDQCITKPDNWSTALENLQEAKNNLNIPQENYIENIQNYEEKYNTYLEKLEEILQQLRDPEIEKKEEESK